jgi:sulfonate transport system substrate-binding protein
MRRPEDPTRRGALARIGAAAGAALLPALASAREDEAPLRIGYQKSSVNLVVARQRGLIEARLPGAALSWVEFPAGPQILEALAAGSLDLGFTGDTPPVFAQAAGRDIRYLGLEPPKPASSAILVPPDSALRGLADLKGRRVAFQKGSSAHYLVLRAVQKAGLAWPDIEPVYLAPSDARAAFERGAVDAWGIWDPYYAAAEVGSRARVLATGVGLTSNNSFYLGSPALAQRPAAVRALFAALSEADAWTHAHVPETAKLFAEATGVPLAGAIRFLGRRRSGPVAALSAADVADQQRVADAFAGLGLVPRAPRVADIVWRPPQALAAAR